MRDMIWVIDERGKCRRYREIIPTAKQKLTKRTKERSVAKKRVTVNVAKKYTTQQHIHNQQATAREQICDVRKSAVDMHECIVKIEDMSEQKNAEMVTFVQCNEKERSTHSQTNCMYCKQFI